MGNIDLLSALTPKKIILNAISDKLEGTGINKITIVFCMETDHYNVLLSNRDGQNMKLEITQDEMNVLKRIYINRIVTYWNKKYPNTKPRSVIIQVVVDEKSLEVFIEDKNKNVLKFEI